MAPVWAWYRRRLASALRLPEVASVARKTTVDLRTRCPPMATRTAADVSLEPGDHLTREEFHRRYCARPDIKKAELIDGVVYVPSPLRYDRHAQPHFVVVSWLGMYVALHPGVQPGGDNGTVFLEGGHEVQPD